MKYVQKHHLLKLPACALMGPKNSANQCWIQKITLPYKFVSLWLFMHTTTGSLQINMYTKPTYCTILQTEFQYISTLKCIVP